MRIYGRTGEESMQDYQPVSGAKVWELGKLATANALGAVIGAALDIKEQVHPTDRRVELSEVDHD